MTARSEDEIRADLTRLEELGAAFRARLERAKEGKMPSRGLSDPAEASEKHDIHARLAADVAELLDSRERAIRWAVTLEGQNAAALAIHEKAYGAFCLECHVAWPCPTVAALTGSTE